MWVLKAAMAGRKPPRGVPRASVAMDMRYAQQRSPFTKAGTDQFLASSHMYDAADAENKDVELFRELQTCPKCKSGRYAQRRIRGQRDTAAPVPGAAD